MFAQIGWLILALLIPGILALGVWTARRRIARLHLLGMTGAINRGRRVRLMLWSGAALSAVIALANPVWGVEAELVAARGTAVVLVLDVSASMDALDLVPSRLERAKLAAADIVQGGEGGLFGMVLFAGEAFVQFPLTTDSETALSFIRSARSAVITRQGTAIESALRLALDVIDTRVSGGAMIVLMTDGENQSGEPLAAAEVAGERGVPIHVIGYGTPEGDVIPVYDASGQQVGLKADLARNIVISHLDEPILQQIADEAGGTYQRASPTGVESVAVLNALAELDAGALGTRFQTTAVSRYAVFIALALLLLTLEMLVRERDP